MSTEVVENRTETGTVFHSIKQALLDLRTGAQTRIEQYGIPVSDIRNAVGGMLDTILGNENSSKAPVSA